MSVCKVNVPDWLKKGSIYQINPRTFSSEGTISAVTKELPFLKSLGFSVMYLCPIFKEDDSTDTSSWSERQKKSGTLNPKNPYRMNDYFTVDEEYGTDSDLKEFIDTAHKLELKVLLDLVYMHIGPNAPILKTHPEFAKHDQNGEIICSIYHFPYLDFECKGLCEYLWCNMVCLVSEFDADGFRCDVGDRVPLEFWAEGKRRIAAVKPDAVLINEGKKSEYLEEVFDSTYCFSWHEAIRGIFDGRNGALFAKEKWQEFNGALPKGALVMRDVDNHDTVTDWKGRTETVAGHLGMEILQVLNFLIDGVPMVYCGNELADEGRLSMFANRFYMGEFEATDREKLKLTKEAHRRVELFKTLNHLKTTEPALSQTEIEWETLNDDILCFKRPAENPLMFIGNFGNTVTLESIGGTVIMSNGAAFNDKITLAKNGYLVIKF